MPAGPRSKRPEHWFRGEVNDFLGLRRAAQVAPTVVALRTMASEVVAAELARLDGRAPLLERAGA